MNVTRCRSCNARVVWTVTEQLRALGNGVVPQQAAHALRILLDLTQEAPCRS